MEKPSCGFRAGGHFEIEHRDKYGNLKSIECIKNIVTDEGLDKILNSLLHNGASATWYVAIIESNTAPDHAMTYAVPVYTESSAYDEATRPEYVEAAASSKSITNSASKAVFTINASKTIYGAALVNVDTKGDTAGGGVLLCYAKFATSKAVEAGDTLNVTYTLSAADDGL